MDRAGARDHEHEVLKLPLGTVETGGPSSLGRVIAVLLVGAAVVVACLPFEAVARAAIALGLVASAFLVHRYSTKPGKPPRGWVTVDPTGVTRTDATGTAWVVRWSEPFGLTVLANHDRSRAIFAFTTPAQARYVGVRFSHANDTAIAHTLLDRATTVAESDVTDAHGNDEEASLVAGDAEQLLLAVAARAKAAPDRMYLSDARGEPVTLDGTKLRLGTRTIDLTSPLEWRGFMFHESAGRVATVYQATWVRQADSEAILVAPLPAESSWMSDLKASAHSGTSHDPLAQRAVVRDLCLMQSSPEEPPPRELRHAIDRLFMLPLRQALDRAPRISRVPPAPSRPMPEGRA